MKLSLKHQAIEKTNGASCSVTEHILNNEEYKLSAGDVVLIEAGDKYYWEGHMQLFISCRPAWNKDQHQLVD
jgi:quercetin dioxygenase-like cupin family protein